MLAKHGLSAAQHDPEGFGGIQHLHASPECAAASAPSLAHAEQIHTFSVPWMNWLDRFLVFTQWGSASFYSCNLKKMWLAVDEENMKLDSNTIYHKYHRELVRAVLMSVLSLAIFPLRFLLGIPFYSYVGLRTRPTDALAKRAKHMRQFFLQMVPILGGCALSARILIRAHGMPLGLSTAALEHQYRHAISQENGSIAQVELIAPFRALLILVVLEVIWKQRRDMSYVVNIIRHHLLVDEACMQRESEVVFGPVLEDEDGWVRVPWLLGQVQSADGDEVTRLALHRQAVEQQWGELLVGTGTISEIADMEADMFFRSGMQDLLEQRMQTLCEIEEMMLRMQVEGKCSRAMPMDFGRLVEVLCAGYPDHFEEEVTILQRPNQVGACAAAIAVVYALIPSAAMVCRGVVFRRLPIGSSDVSEIPFLIPLSAVASYLTLRTLFSRLSSAYSDLTNTHEAFVILHRMASTQHRRRAEYTQYRLKRAKSNESCIKNHFSDGVKDRQISSDSPLGVHVQPREQRKRVRFKACLMRGADCHVSVGHKYRFDAIMRRHYNTESHQHSTSFVELDLHTADQLRMWWVTRRSIEAGLLRHKVFAELLLVFTLIILVLLLGFSLSWFALVGHAVVSNFMTVWDMLFLSLATLRVVKACVRLNTVLESDSKRLTFIQHDLVEEIASPDPDARRSAGLPIRAASAGAAGPQSPKFRSSPRWSFQDLARSGPRASLPWSADTARDSSQEREAVLQLLGVYIDHLDRDHRPLQIWGLTVNQPFLSRAYAVVFSGVCTGIVRLTARLLFSLNEQPA